MVDEDEISPDVINAALDEAERKESHMTKQEITIWAGLDKAFVINTL